MSFELGDFEKRNLDKLGLTKNDLRLLVDFRNNFLEYLNKYYPWHKFTDQDLKSRVNKLITELDENIENILYGVPVPPKQSFREIINKATLLQAELVNRKTKGQL